MTTFREQILGTVLGAAVGDALGHETEFMSMEQIYERFGPTGITGFGRWGEQDGRRVALYTDDTQMAEIVLRNLLDAREHGRSLEDTMEAMGRDFVEWSTHPQGGHRAPGNSCLAGCRALAAGASWFEAGDEAAGGCGSVMRSYPFGILFADDIYLAERWAVAHSRLTHRAPLAFAACAAMARGVALALRGATPDAIAQDMITAAGRYCSTTQSMLADAYGEAKAGIAPEITLDRLRGWTGHEAVSAGLYLFVRNQADGRRALLEGANSPGDSDSIATLAGALCGARFGLGAFPSGWIGDVERSDVLRALADAVGQCCERIMPVDVIRTTTTARSPS